MRITIGFSPPLEERADQYRRLASDGIYESLGRLAQRVDPLMLAALQGEAPENTGAYKGTIHSVQHGGVGEIVLEYRAADPLTTFIIQGTAPHVIEASRASVLAFYNGGGELVFARSVNHPGTKPNDYPNRAWNAASSAIIAQLAETGREILTQVQ